MSLSARSAFQRLWPYVRPVAGITALGFLATALVAATEAYVPAFLRRLLDEGFSPHAPQSAWWSISLAFLGLACLRGVAQFSSSYLLGYVSNNVVIRIREAMIERVVRAGAPFFQRETASTIINAVVSEANQVLLIVTSALVTSVQGALTVIGYLAYLFYLNWRLTLVIAVVLPGIGWLAGQINRRMRRLNREQQAMTNDLSYVVEEIVSGYKVVKIHGGEQYEIDRFMAMSRRLKGYAIRSIASGGLAQSLTQLLASIAIAVVIAISIYQALHGHGNGNDFMTYILATLLAISPLKQLMSVNQPLQRGMTAAELIFRLIDEPPEAIRGGRRIEKARGEIEYREVSFAYEGAARPTLERISFTIRPGDMVALVGPSGGGKTTLANLLPRFFDPTGGAILLDGVPITELDMHDLRGQIAMVSQDVVLFNDSIAANVAYGSTPDPERVWAALRAANLADTVAAMPDGLDAMIGGDGMRLSGGQRQRLAIARAIYKDAAVLILDEATSALDSESERLVQDALECLMAGRATIVIAHRLSTIERADRILVLEAGRIVEQGSHAVLLQAGGRYARLHRTQYQQEASASG
ncbi:lipid A export permease/ATP-binding protein MsbA [Burkholderia gladioli]|uniref:lipid A export permease/ATP-binding protein MsbA n=1 Tax=Burkholderia gladioli TaxID=28095 RepID=UPI000CFF1D0B|nr:lipid A export permease/ATP-binding protein MsbA [Burkholderia gladioli]PRG47400.1 lipid A export permease/ATP-binding protein MsbA [Burkholderia gladioli]